MKKALGIALVICMTLGMLTGCGSSLPVKKGSGGNLVAYEAAGEGYTTTELSGWDDTMAKMDLLGTLVYSDSESTSDDRARLLYMAFNKGDKDGEFYKSNSDTTLELHFYFETAYDDFNKDTLMKEAENWLKGKDDYSLKGTIKGKVGSADGVIACYEKNGWEAVVVFLLKEDTETPDFSTAMRIVMQAKTGDAEATKAMYAMVQSLSE